MSVVTDWRKWGFGLSMDFGEPKVLRVWVGPWRFGWVYERVHE